MFKKSISLVLSIIMLMAMCVFAPVTNAETGDAEYFEFTQNFNSIYQTAYTPEQYTTNTGLATTKSGGAGLWIANDDEAGADRVARLDHAGGVSKASLSYEFPSSVTKDVLSVSFKLNFEKINASVSNFLVDLFTFYCGDKTASTVNINKTNYNGFSATPGKDADEYHNLRAVALRTKTTADWDLVIYDDTTATPVPVYQGTLSAATFESIDKVMLCSTYTEKDGSTIRIDDVEIKSYKYVEPTVEVDFSQNFDSIYPSSYNDADYTSHTGLVSERVSGGGLWVDGPQTAGANRRAKFTHSNQGSRVRLYHNLDAKKVKKGGLSVGYKISATEVAGSGNLAMLTFYSGANFANTLVYYGAGQGAGVLRVNDGSTKNLAVTVGEDNMYSLKADVYRATEDVDWTLRVYDENAAVPTVLYKAELSKDIFTYIDKVCLVNTYAMTASDYYVIDDVFVKTFDSYNGKIKQDFDDLDDAIDTEAELEAATGIDFTNSGAAVSVIDESGNKKLKLSHTTTGQKVNLKYAIPVMTKGTVTFSAKFGQNGTLPDAGVWRIGKIYNGETETTLIDRHSAESFKKYEVSGFSYNFRKDSETEMYHIRIVVSRNDEDSNWIYQIWDDGGKANDAPVKIDSGELSKEDYEKIDAIGFVGSYAMGNTNIIVDDVEIDYYKGITLNSVHFGSSGATIDRIAEGISDLTAYIRLHSSDKEISSLTILMGVYSGEGRLLSVATLPIEQIGPEANETPITLSATGFKTDVNSYVQLFFLEDLTSIRPLRAAGGLSSAGFCE